MNPGKMFEADMKASLQKENLFVLRLKDDAVNFRQRSDNLCDFLVYQATYLYLLELKSYKGASIPLAKLTQFSGLIAYEAYQGICPLFVLNFRDFEETYCLSPSQLLLINDRKSVSLAFARKHGVKLPQTRKRTRYTYYFSKILGGLNYESIC